MPGERQEYRLKPERDRTLLIGLAGTMMLSLTSFFVLAPFLLVLSEDFRVDLPSVSGLVAATSVAWALGALLVGPISDRFGRRPVLLIGLAAMAISTILGGAAWDYLSFLVSRLLVGASGSMVNPSVMSLVADEFPADRRGRAYSWVLAGTSLSSLFGVPAVTLVASFTNWRWAMMAVGVLMLALCLYLWRSLPVFALSGRTSRSIGGAIWSVFRSPGFSQLFGANCLEKFWFQISSTFLAAFLITAYGVDLQTLGLLLAIIAGTGLIGIFIGGRLADKATKTQVFGVTQLMGAVVVVLLFVYAPALWASVALAGMLTFISAIGRPVLNVFFSEVSSQWRGTAMGLWGTSNNIGHAAGAAVGGMVIASSGYAALGPLCAIVAVVTAGLVYSFGSRICPVAVRVAAP